jgi:putative salt-induced outer membrane protein YdiY
MNRSFRSPLLLAVAAHLTVLSVLGSAFAQSVPTGAPPPEAKALVAGPTKPGDAPKIESKTDGTSVTVSAGGQASTGNSRLLALTANGAFDTRFDNNGIGVSALANYGQSAPPGEAIKTTTENVQGRVRYDRYIIDQASFFLITTGRHDRFQGIDFRLNLDPGFKYLFVAEQANAIWAEIGYDFQYDIRRDDALVDPMMMLPTLDKTATDHSSRLFAGMRHAFNDEVTLSTGVEYLQSLVETTRNRINFDALFAAKVGSGLAFGLGFGLRYDHEPLPGKAKVDTTTNVSLIYAFSHAKEEPAPVNPPTSMPPPPPPAGPDNAAPLPATGGAAPSSGTPPAPVNPPPSSPPATEPSKPATP